MKLKLITLLIFSTSAFAIDRIECNGNEIEMSLNYWGNNTSNSRVVLSYRDQEGRIRREQFTMLKSSSRSSTLRFSSSGRTLEID